MGALGSGAASIPVAARSRNPFMHQSRIKDVACVVGEVNGYGSGIHASLRQRRACSRGRAGLTDSFRNGRRSSPGTAAAINQDVRLISSTHTSVLSGLGAMRELVKSSGLGGGFSIAVSAMR